MIFNLFLFFIFGVNNGGKKNFNLKSKKRVTCQCLVPSLGGTLFEIPFRMVYKREGPKIYCLLFTVKFLNLTW